MLERPRDVALLQQRSAEHAVRVVGIWLQLDHPPQLSSSQATTRQLALVEMRGEQIARMRNFGPISAATVASTTLLAAATPCAARATD